MTSRRASSRPKEQNPLLAESTLTSRTGYRLPYILNVSEGHEREKMEETKRPGVLTALAVINFIIAFMYCIDWFIFSLAFIVKIPLDKFGEAEAARLEAMGQLSAGTSVFMFGLAIIPGILLLLAGIGYLKQNKMLGWAMGNAYAAVMILGIMILPFIILPPELQAGSVLIIIALAYPIITIVLINFVYKKNLVN